MYHVNVMHNKFGAKYSEPWEDLSLHEKGIKVINSILMGVSMCLIWFECFF